MPFLSPNQQCQSTEGKFYKFEKINAVHLILSIKSSVFICFRIYEVDFMLHFCSDLVYIGKLKNWVVTSFCDV